MYRACVSATVLILASVAIGDALAQSDPFKPQTTPRTIVLWPDGAPGAVGKDDADVPTVTIFPGILAGHALEILDERLFTVCNDRIVACTHNPSIRSVVPLIVRHTRHCENPKHRTQVLPCCK